MRRLKLFVAMLAMVLMVASPAAAQTIEFFGEDGVFILTGGAAGVVAEPDFGLGFTRASFAGGDPQLGAAAFGGGVCVDTTNLGVCP